MKEWERGRLENEKKVQKGQGRGKALLVEAIEEADTTSSSGHVLADDQQENETIGENGFIDFSDMLTDEQNAHDKKPEEEMESSTPPNGTSAEQQPKIHWQKKVSLQCEEWFLYIDDTPVNDGHPLVQSPVKAKELGSNISFFSSSKFLFVLERIDWVEELFRLRVATNGQYLKVDSSGNLTLSTDDNLSSAPSLHISSSFSAATSSDASTSALSLRRRPSTAYSPLLFFQRPYYFYFESSYINIAEAQIFKRERQARKTFAFKSYHNCKYLTVEPDHTVSASSEDVGPMQLFRIIYK